MSLERPQYFWVNQVPYILASEATAHNGNVCIVRTPKNDLIGFPMTVRFVFARASDILTWQGMGSGNPFTILGKTVIFQTNNPVQYENMVIKDSFVDVNLTLPPAFDYWAGSLNLRIMT